ncbi:MAG: sugar phosphate isomerase/epimerase family protein, partial [Planctomycetota bacterium]
MVKTNKPISRRQMMKTSLAGATVLASTSAVRAVTKVKKASVRLGGPTFEKYEDPAGWIAALKKLGYRAAYCPVGANAGDDVVRAYERAAKDANIIIAEVGAWSNPISPDEKMRKEAQEKCRRQLRLADRIGAKCCVNISGSRSDRWEGPSPDNLTEETFEMIVETTRAIIDDVKPTRT